MADSYVVSTAMLRCTMGSAPSMLTVLPIRTVFMAGMPMGNISDFKPLVNIAPFGLCMSLANPVVAAATAANLGRLQPMPCIPNTVAPWFPGKPDTLIKGQPALLKSCQCACMWAGMISITDDGQHAEGTQYVNKSNKSSYDEIQTNETQGLTVDSALDGIQLALDAAGFIPGFGAIPDLTNAAISALRGNWVDAGLSVLAAVPLVGDIAAGAKMAKKGTKMAKMAKKCVSRNVDLSIEGLAKHGMSVEEANAFRKAVRNERRTVAFDFYKKNGFKDDSLIDSHLQGIDFDKPIKVDKIPHADEKEITLYQYRNLSNKVKNDEIGHFTTLEYKSGNYFTTNPNATPGDLGIADSYSLNVSKAPDGMPQQLGLPFQKQRFSIKITKETTCLRSTSKTIEDTWSMPGQSIQTKGGSEQLFIPDNGFASSMIMD